MPPSGVAHHQQAILIFLLLILNLSQLLTLLRGHELCPLAQILGYYLLTVNLGNEFVEFSFLWTKWEIH